MNISCMGECLTAMPRSCKGSKCYENPLFENKDSAGLLFDVKIWQPEMIPT